MGLLGAIPNDVAENRTSKVINIRDFRPNSHCRGLFLYQLQPDLYFETYRLKLTQIFNTYMSKDDALKNLSEWMREVRLRKLTCFDGFIKTLRKYKNEVANYFIDRNTSAFVEGVNNKAKVLKRRCYGIFNVKHLFQRLHLDLSGYRLFGLISVGPLWLGFTEKRGEPIFRLTGQVAGGSSLIAASFCRVITLTKH